MNLRPCALTVLAGIAFAFAIAFLFRMFLFNGSSNPIFYSNTYDAVQPFMEGIYTADKTIDAPKDYKIRALIVPHHLTATTTIASGFKMLEHQKFSKILLLTPDHFNNCPKIACTVNGIFKTIFGEVRSSPDTFKKLLSSDIIVSSPDLFKNEHGIYGVLPYISDYFPNVTVTPLVLSQRIPWESQRDELLLAIEDQMDSDTILVLSSDFSHYLSLSKADEMDEKTAQMIFSKDLNGIAKLENPSQSDCPNCLWLLGSIADKENFYNPSVILHTNSARILNDEKIPETTSHFSMVWYENNSLNQTDLAVAGDVTLTRASDMPALPKTISDWWSGSGLRLVNLEGPLAKKCNEQTNPYLFCNPEELWLKIKQLATHWSVMNNHMLDMGTRGFAETKKIIQSADESVLTDKHFEDKDVRIYAFTAIINPVSQSRTFSISKIDKTILADLKKHNDGKLNIVFVHYGTEYQTLTMDAENKFLESFIDAGADAVIGCHSHVVSDMRFYKEKPIFHGLGNFIFDQSDSLATSTSELVRLKKQNNRILFETLIAPTSSA